MEERMKWREENHEWVMESSNGRGGGGEKKDAGSTCTNERWRKI